MLIESAVESWSCQTLQIFSHSMYVPCLLRHPTLLNIHTNSLLGYVFYTLCNIPCHKFSTAAAERLFVIIHQLVSHVPTSSRGIVPVNQLFHSISVTMISRLMLNLHAAAPIGIFSTVPMSDIFTGVAFTSRAPDNLSFETQLTTPTQCLHVAAEHIVQEIGLPEIEMEQGVGA